MLEEDEETGRWYRSRYGYDVAHLSGHWWEREEGWYYIFSCQDLRKFAHYKQIELADETPLGYLFKITKNGIERVKSKYEIEIGEDLPEIEE